TATPAAGQWRRSGPGSSTGAAPTTARHRRTRSPPAPLPAPGPSASGARSWHHLDVDLEVAGGPAGGGGDAADHLAQHHRRGARADGDDAPPGQPEEAGLLEPRPQ